MKRAAVAAGLLLTAAGSSASTPVGRQHGARHVTAISSLSGTEGNDAAVSLTQEAGETEFEVRWLQQGNNTVQVAARAQDCAGDDDDFAASYTVPTRRWLAVQRAVMIRRIGSDLAAWKAQAELACRPSRGLNALRMEGLGAAVRDFAERVAYLSGVR